MVYVYKITLQLCTIKITKQLLRIKNELYLKTITASNSNVDNRIHELYEYIDLLIIFGVSSYIHVACEGVSRYSI